MSNEQTNIDKTAKERQERYQQIFPNGINTTYSKKNTEGKLQDPRLKDNNSKTTAEIRETAKQKSPQKRKKKELRKKVIIRMKITVAILAMAAGGLAVKQFIKINKGKEALREIGHQAMPVDEYSISPGENGYTVMNVKTNHEATYGEYINAIRNNATDQNIDEIAVYIAVEESLGKTVAEDVYGKKSNEEIAEAALAYLDSLEESQEKGRGGR